MQNRFKSWTRKLISLVVFAPFLLGNAPGSAGCSNVFAEGANKTSPEALLFAARQHLDTQDWDGAITILNTMSASDRNAHDARVVEASAYAGRCGLRLIDLANTFVNQIGSTTLMAIMLNYMKSATSYSDCLTAESKLTGIATAEATPDDYVFLAFLEFVKIGGILKVAGADTDNDGAVGPGFSGCSISRANAIALGASLNTAISAINSSGVSIASSVTNAINGLCSSGYPCGKTSGFTDTELAGILTLVHTNNIGLNTCPGPFSVACACAPPP